MKLLNQMLDNFQKTAKRIETLPRYNISTSNVRYASFLNGEIKDDFSDSRWCDSIKKWTSEGKVIERIRVVPQDFNQYLQFEFECYRKNILAGESISCIYEKDYIDLITFRGDIWIFDESKFLKMNYDNCGAFLGSELIENENFINQYKILLKKCFVIEEVYKKIRNQEFKVY